MEHRENHSEVSSGEPVFAAVEAPLALGVSLSRARRAASLAPSRSSAAALQVQRRHGIAVGEAAARFELPGDRTRLAAWMPWQPMRETPAIPDARAPRPMADRAPVPMAPLPDRMAARAAWEPPLLPLPLPSPSRQGTASRQPDSGASARPAPPPPDAAPLPGPAPLIERRAPPSWGFGLDPSPARPVASQEPAPLPSAVVLASRAPDVSRAAAPATPYEAIARTARAAAPEVSLPALSVSPRLAETPGLSAPPMAKGLVEMTGTLRDLVEREVSEQVARAAEQMRSELRASERQAEPSRPPVDVTSDDYVRGLMRRIQALSEQERLRRGLR